MKVNAITIRPGHVLEYEGKLMLVTRIEIIQPGKGNAVIQVEMKDARTGVKTQNRFRTQETVERARLDEHEVQFLYAEGDEFTFMDKENFEQTTVNRELIGDAAAFLQEGMTCTITSHEGAALSIEIPPTAIFTVTEAEPVVRGQTASSSYKPALLENGVRVMVPPHIEPGTRVVVNTADGTYAERAKS